MAVNNVKRLLMLLLTILMIELVRMESILDYMRRREDLSQVR